MFKNCTRHSNDFILLYIYKDIALIGQKYVSTILILLFRQMLDVENIPSCFQGRIQKREYKISSRRFSPLLYLGQAGAIVWVN